MTSNKITLAIFSSAGRQRLQVERTCRASALKTKIRDSLDIKEDFKVIRDNGRGRPGSEEMKLTGMTSVLSMGLKNGDVIHVFPLSGTRFHDPEEGSSHNGGNSSEKFKAESTNDTTDVKILSTSGIEEDKVDVELSKMDGKIKQSRTSSCKDSCKNGGCIYCTSKDPYDPEYLKKEGIKFMSFHSYLRKVEHEKGSLAKSKLDEINLSIKPGCTSCPGWPEGLCSKCQPPALTLNRQTYRHVDHITFENGDIVDNFLNFWRVTSHQRAGILYGRYETFSGVPLGIQAVVSAIYEPGQQGTRDSIKLFPDEDGKQAQVDRIANSLGLCRVGWIFTDLVQTNSSGKIKHVRHADSHYLSAQECITAANFQNMYPNITKKSSSLKFGSKQVTIVVTGDAENQIGLEAYQVSQQCMAMVRAGVLLPTKDAPELGYVREPKVGPNLDVFYKLKDQYGNEVTKVARPLPVEYLLIDIPSGFSSASPSYSMSLEKAFFSGSKKPFPIENRPMEGQLQTIEALANYRKMFDDNFSDLFRDFHLLIYLSAQTDVPLSEEDMKPLLEAIRDSRLQDVYRWADNQQWQTLELIMNNMVDGFQ